MAAQNAFGSSTTLRQASKASSAESAKTKRARTKHACDECRRSQKKCDGDKPLCRRCYLNGTNCTYTPHKSRNQCICSGQGEETRGDTSGPDVFIFADTTSSSFHTWSATSSPDQSPSASVSALETPSPTTLGQDDRFGSAQNERLELSKPIYESEIYPSRAMLQRSRHIYNHRSYSLPSFSSTYSASPSPHVTEPSSFPASVSFPRNLTEETVISTELGTIPSTQSGTNTLFRVTADGLPDYSDLIIPNQGLPEQSVEHGTFFDISSYYPQQISEDARLNSQQVLPLTSDLRNLRSSNNPVYKVSQYEQERCVRDPSSIATSSLPVDWSSRVEQTSSSYSPWITQGHANSLSSTYSHVRAASDIQDSTQSAHYRDGINDDSMSLRPANNNTEAFTGGTHIITDDVTILPSGVGRQNPRMMLLNLPTPRFYGPWGNEAISPLLTGSYPSSTSPSPSAHGVNDFYY